MLHNRYRDKTKSVSLCTTRLSQLSIPIPPTEFFEAAIGYTGNNERYVAFYFEEGEIFYEDAATWDLGNVEPFRLWSDIVPKWRYQIEYAHIEHPSNDGVSNWLLLDRHIRRIYYGPSEAVIRILAGQLPLPGRAGRPQWERIRADVTTGMTEWYTALEKAP